MNNRIIFKNKQFDKVNELIPTNQNKKVFFIFLCLFAILSFFFKEQIKNILYINNKEKIIYFDKYEVNIYNKIKEKFEKERCSEVWANQREFLNGIIRKLKPKKILEIGIRHGGSSIIILNAINDFKDSKLFSIDISSSKNIVNVFTNFFQNFYRNGLFLREI